MCWCVCTYHHSCTICIIVQECFKHYPVFYIRLLCLSVITITKKKLQFKNSKFLVFTNKVIAHTLYDIKLMCLETAVSIQLHTSVLTLLMFCGVTRDNTILLKHLIYLKYTTALCPGYIKT